MNEESKRDKAGEKPTVRQRILSWLGFLAVLAAIIFFFAPESWWQFGVAPMSERKSSVDFSLKEIDGGEWDFGEQRGRVVLVNYWATWCPPCRVEMPGLVNAANEYKNRGVEFIGITMDENLADVPPFVAKYEIPFPILLPEGDPNSGLATALPTTLLFDKNGRLAKKYTGIVLESTLKSDIEILLAESSEKSAAATKNPSLRLIKEN